MSDIENNVPSAEETKAEITEDAVSTEETVDESAGQDESAAAPEENDVRFVKMTIDSGVAPIEIRYSQINSCYRKLPIAYRSFTYINSVVEGIISPEKYAYAADETETGVRLAKYNIKAAMRAIEKFIIAGRNIEFVSVRIPARLVLETDFYGAIKSIIDEYGFQFPDKLCLEFPRTLLFEDEEKARMAILSMKLLKVKTMMTGCGAKDSPVTPLINLPVDYLLLSDFITTLADSRDKGTTVSAFIAFLRGLPCNIIGDGVYNDEQITALSRADCFGYIPSSGYKGSVEHGRLRMPLDEAIAQREEEEF
ncbi:MAG: EAL domain-containing protein [Clostridia bacterium]|nr:EAL domain-containing protein [Clostridia bacterium]